MTDLVEFLRARLDEDAVEAETDEVLAHEQATGWLPERVLRQVQANRRIVEHAQEWGATLNTTPAGWTDATATAYRMAMEWTLRLLALPYADHPDYDEAWRP